MITPPEKRCPRCRAVYPATREHFAPDKKARDGFNSWCRPCRRAVKRASHLAKARCITAPAIADSTVRQLYKLIANLPLDGAISFNGYLLQYAQLGHSFPFYVLSRYGKVIGTEHVRAAYKLPEKRTLLAERLNELGFIPNRIVCSDYSPLSENFNRLRHPRLLPRIQVESEVSA